MEAVANAVLVRRGSAQVEALDKTRLELLRLCN